MKKLFITLLVILQSVFLFAQIDKEQLALDVSNEEAANQEKLKAFIWKRHSTATVDGEMKVTVITEFKFDEKGELQADQVGGESNVKQKRGIRGRIQHNAIEE